MIGRKLLSTMSSVKPEPLYVDDVFSAYTYAGNNASQIINNGIDLAGKGGIVWTKGRNLAAGNILQDTVRGLVASSLYSNATDAAKATTGSISSFNNNGYTLSGGVGGNGTGYDYVSWTFRKSPKFFDIVTYTGDGALYRNIAHELGIAPGLVIIKPLTETGNWRVGTSTGYGLWLNTTDQYSSLTLAGGKPFPYAEYFQISQYGNSVSAVNKLGVEYVAYLFAHDPSPDGIIQCGEFTGATYSINLGWEPQYVLMKTINATGDWEILDSSRGMPVTNNDKVLYANTSGTEFDSGSYSSDRIMPTANGFIASNPNGYKCIFMAIRRPNKPPKLGTQVYNAIARTGTGVAVNVSGVGFSPDLSLITGRIAGIHTGSFYDRLRGPTRLLQSNAIAIETAPGGMVTPTMNGVTLNTEPSLNGATYAYINWFFKRAPGVFDIVCYIGNASSGIEIPHSLTVTPELIITKVRDVITKNWDVHIPAINALAGYLNLTSAFSYRGDYSATDKIFKNISGNNLINHVSYLFATKAGISKVGNYTGNGGSQVINCGFITGSRFILIKRTDAAGDWFVWDTARGIVASNDPHLSLNTTAAEVTTDDSIDPDLSGFIVNQNAITNINVSGGSYIFLSFA